jgi:DNA-binding transcriptional ArsR family regulator
VNDCIHFVNTVSAANLLFCSEVEGRLLAIMLDDPSREWSSTAVAQAAATSQPTASRQLNRAEQAGVLRSRKEGQSRLFRVNNEYPLLRPLRELVVALYGLPTTIARALSSVRGVSAAFIFGSWAARYSGESGPAPMDIDVLVVGAPDRDALDDIVERLERADGRRFDFVVRSDKAWNSTTDPFITEVKSRPLVALEVTPK